jgi:hypothetical protein
MRRLRAFVVMKRAGFCHSITFAVIMFVVPAWWSGSPAVIATKSPRLTRPD